MSLISEGLKKAQLDAMRQDREQRRTYMGSGRTDVPPQSGNGLVIAAAALAGAVLAAGGAVYMQKLKNTTAPAPAVITSAVTPKAAQPAAAPKAPVVTRTATATTTHETPAKTVRKPDAAPIAVEAAAAPKRAEVPREKPRLREEPQPAVAATEPAREEAPRERPRTARRDNLVNGETYMSPIVGPGGAEIALTGISSTRGQSVAILNGNVVRAGSVIGPFVVEDIEPTRVKLRYIDVSIYLTY